MVYTVKKEPTFTREAVAIDDMILTKDSATTAGSKMLDGYVSLFDATVAEKLSENYEILGKVAVSEFALGMTADAAVKALDEKEIKAVVGLDANGSYRRSAAISDKVFVKPTYGTVSRFGLIPVACSGDTVGVLAGNVEDATEVLGVMAGHDDKDGTSLPQEVIAKAKDKAPVKKVALVKQFLQELSTEMKKKTDDVLQQIQANGVEVELVDGEILTQAKAAWAILSSAEFCNNVSKYDGVKYGYRAKGCRSIEEIYVNSRSEGFGETVKSMILYGSHVLSTENYEKTYEKALRVRRLIREYFDKLFEEYDAVMMPACSSFALEENADASVVYEEGKYTAPASITGLPVVVASGLQWLGKPLTEGSLLAFCGQLA